MQRRTHHPLGRDASHSTPAQQPSLPKSSAPLRVIRPPKEGGPRISVLLLIASVLAVLIYIFPAENRQMVYETEQRFEQVAYETEQRLEHDLIDWFGQRPPREEPEDLSKVLELRKEADNRMLQQDSKWVDSEKKLKMALQELVARQAEGKDLGVPVLTRWLGEDVPAFAGEGVNVDEWNKVVVEKYAAMRVEEEQWRKLITESLATSRSR